MGLDRAAVTALRRWHGRRGRQFPWRESRDAYTLTVTEMMLIRTRAEQVADVWPRFFSQFPSLDSLATADSSAVERALAPLGLKWRARRIRDFARQAREAGAEVPVGPDAARLAGVGPYVRDAVYIGVTGSGPLPIDVTIARVIGRIRGPTDRGGGP